MACCPSDRVCPFFCGPAVCLNQAGCSLRPENPCGILGLWLWRRAVSPAGSEGPGRVPVPVPNLGARREQQGRAGGAAEGLPGAAGGVEGHAAEVPQGRR